MPFYLFRNDKKKKRFKNTCEKEVLKRLFRCVWNDCSNFFTVAEHSADAVAVAVAGKAKFSENDPKVIDTMWPGNSINSIANIEHR